MNPEPMPDLIVVPDTGTSQTRTFWRRWSVSGKTQLLLMGSEFLEIAPADLVDTGFSGGRPEQDAVIELANGNLYAIGMKAQQMRGKPPTDLNKYEFAVYKTLAGIGAIAQTLDLPEHFTVAIAALLPYVEYRDKARFIDLLTANLDCFRFRGQSYSVTPTLLEVKPEGAGLAHNRRNEAPHTFDQQNTLVGIVGQRDASLLPFKQGTADDGKGERLGFGRFLEDVISRAALNLPPRDVARMTEYLFKAQTEPQYLDRMARLVVTEAERERKVEQIREAIATAKKRYLADLLEWMQHALGADLYEFDEVIFSGGGALYLRSDLEAFFAQYNLSVSWADTLQHQISQSLGYSLDPVMACRVSDAFGVYKVLGGKVQRLTQTQNLTTALR